MRFLRRINRGLILTVLTLLGVGAYLTALGIQHAADRPVLLDVAQKYVQTLASAQLLPEKYRVEKPDIPAAELAARVKEAQDSVAAFYPEGTRQGKTVTERVASKLTAQADGTAEVYKSLSAKFKLTKLRFSGETASVMFEITPQGTYVSGKSVTDMPDKMSYGSGYGDLTIGGQQIVLQKTGGAWKITYANVNFAMGDTAYGGYVTSYSYSR